MAVSSPAPASNQELRGDPETITGDTGEEAGDWRRRQSSSHSQHTTASSSISVREEVLAEKEVHLSELENLVRAAEMKAELVRKEKDLSKWERNIRLRKLECKRRLAEASKILSEGRHSDTGSISSPRSLISPVPSLISSSTGRAVSLCSPPAEPCDPGPPSQHSTPRPPLLPPPTLQMFGSPRVLPPSAKLPPAKHTSDKHDYDDHDHFIIDNNMGKDDVKILDGNVVGKPAGAAMDVEKEITDGADEPDQEIVNAKFEERTVVSQLRARLLLSRLVPGLEGSAVLPRPEQTVMMVKISPATSSSAATQCEENVETVEAEPGSGAEVVGGARVLRKRRPIDWVNLGCAVWGSPPRKMRRVRSSSKEEAASSRGGTPGPGSSSLNAPRLSTPPRKMRGVRSSSKAASCRRSTPGPGSTPGSGSTPGPGSTPRPGSSSLNTPRLSSRSRGRSAVKDVMEDINYTEPVDKKELVVESKKKKPGLEGSGEKKKRIVKLAKKQKKTVQLKKKRKRRRGPRKVKMQFQKGIIAGIKITLALWDQLKNETFRGGDKFPYLLTYKLNQDVLENLFSAVRSLGGSDTNPNPLQFCTRIRILKVCECC